VVYSVREIADDRKFDVRLRHWYLLTHAVTLKRPAIWTKAAYAVSGGPHLRALRVSSRAFQRLG
jgi:hypothetical protein